jgi:hypothetical protein
VAPRRIRDSQRVTRLRASHSYRYPLALILVSFVFAATAPDANWARSILIFIQSATLVAALWTSGLTKYVRLSIATVAVATAVALFLVFTPSDALTGVAGILGLILTFVSAAVIAYGVVDQGEVNSQSVTGAICIYLLLGLMFTFLYGAVSALDSRPFFSQGTDGTFAIRLYFSYITLATVGYGDYTAASNFGHMMAVLEALIGQLYLVTVVALLVSRVGFRRPSD